MLDSTNRLFVLARQGRRQPSALIAILITLVMLAAALVVGQIATRAATRALFANVEPGQPIADGVQELLDFALHFLPIFLLLWMWTFGADAIAGGALTLAGTVIQSSGEEVLFRGWLMPTLGARHGPWIGVIGSSLIFGVAHGLNPNVTLAGLFNLSLFGAFLALYALAVESLWGACAWHALWNWTAATVFGLSDSGGPLHSALLVSVNTRGPHLLTGGAFGPDGGLIETAVLLIGIAVLLFTGRRTETAGR